MAIIRVQKNKNYTTMSNIHLKDKNLSLKAKGLLSVFLNLPDNWDYSVRGLSEICKETKDTINGIIHELEKNGYVERKRIYNNGKISEWEYLIYENNLHPKNQDIEKQDIENYDVNKILNNKILNNISTSSTIEEKNLFDFIQENFGRTLAPIEYEEIKTWEDNELTRYAIKQAVLNGKYGIKYISKILYEYQKNNVTTVQQAQQREFDYQKQKETRKNLNYKHHKTQREREEEAIAKFLSESDD